MARGLGRLGLLRLLALGGALWIGGAGRVAAESRLTQEQIRLLIVSSFMDSWHRQHVPEPRSWPELEALMESSGVEERNADYLLSPMSQAGYRITDRYEFPPVPLRMPPGSVEDTHDKFIVLMRNVPLANPAGPFREPRLSRSLIVRQRGEDSEARYFRTVLEESAFQRLLSKHGVSLPHPAGAPAYDNEHGERLWLHRWWPLACWPVVLGMLVWMFVARHRERALFTPDVTGLVSIAALLLLAVQPVFPPDCDLWLRGLVMAASVLLALLVVRHSESSKSFGVFLACLGLPLLTLMSWSWARW